MNGKNNGSHFPSMNYPQDIQGNPNVYIRTPSPPSHFRPNANNGHFIPPSPFNPSISHFNFIPPPPPNPPPNPPTNPPPIVSRAPPPPPPSLPPQQNIQQFESTHKADVEILQSNFQQIQNKKNNPHPTLKHYIPEFGCLKVSTGMIAKVSHFLDDLREDSVWMDSDGAFYKVRSRTSFSRIVDSNIARCDCPNTDTVCSHLYMVASRFPTLRGRFAAICLTRTLSSRQGGRQDAFDLAKMALSQLTGKSNLTGAELTLALAEGLCGVMNFMNRRRLSYLHTNSIRGKDYDTGMAEWEDDGEEERAETTFFQRKDHLIKKIMYGEDREEKEERVEREGFGKRLLDTEMLSTSDITVGDVLKCFFAVGYYLLEVCGEGKQGEARSYNSFERMEMIEGYVAEACEWNSFSDGQISMNWLLARINDLSPLIENKCYELVIPERKIKKQIVLTRNVIEEVLESVGKGNEMVDGKDKREKLEIEINPRGQNENKHEVRKDLKTEKGDNSFIEEINLEDSSDIEDERVVCVDILQGVLESLLSEARNASILPSDVILRMNEGYKKKCFKMGVSRIANSLDLIYERSTFQSLMCDIFDELQEVDASLYSSYCELRTLQPSLDDEKLINLLNSVNSAFRVSKHKLLNLKKKEEKESSQRKTEEKKGGKNEGIISYSSISTSCLHNLYLLNKGIARRPRETSTTTISLADIIQMAKNSSKGLLGSGFLRYDLLWDTQFSTQFGEFEDFINENYSLLSQFHRMHLLQFTTSSMSSNSSSLYCCYKFQEGEIQSILREHFTNLPVAASITSRYVMHCITQLSHISHKNLVDKYLTLYQGEMRDLSLQLLSYFFPGFDTKKDTVKCFSLLLKFIIDILYSVPSTVLDNLTSLPILAELLFIPMEACVGGIQSIESDMNISHVLSSIFQHNSYSPLFMAQCLAFLSLHYKLPMSLPSPAHSTPPSSPIAPPLQPPSPPPAVTVPATPTISKSNSPIAQTTFSEATLSEESYRKIIDRIRKEEFGVDNPNPSPVFLSQRRKLSRTIQKLSTELYAHKSHALLELLQNADDNEYPANIIPQIHLLVTQKGLLVVNNEKGFSEKDIYSICDIALSSKAGASNKIGKFGIGFKSVFVVTDTPYVFSGSLRMMFNARDASGLGYCLPQWVEKDKTQIIDEETWKCWKDIEGKSFLGRTENMPRQGNREESRETFIWLPFRDEFDGHYFYEKVLSFDISNLLFLRKLENIKLLYNSSAHGENVIVALHGGKKNEVFEGSMSQGKCIEKVFWRNGVQREHEKKLFLIANKDGIEIAVEVNKTGEVNTEKIKKYLFSSLPIRPSGFKFHMNAPFSLLISREDITDSDSNFALLDKVPGVLYSLVKALIQDHYALHEYKESSKSGEHNKEEDIRFSDQVVNFFKVEQENDERLCDIITFLSMNVLSILPLVKEVYDPLMIHTAKKIIELITAKPVIPSFDALENKIIFKKSHECYAPGFYLIDAEAGAETGDTGEERRGNFLSLLSSSFGEVNNYLYGVNNSSLLSYPELDINQFLGILSNSQHEQWMKRVLMKQHSLLLQHRVMFNFFTEPSLLPHLSPFYSLIPIHLPLPMEIRSLFNIKNYSLKNFTDSVIHLFRAENQSLWASFPIYPQWFSLLYITLSLFMHKSTPQEILSHIEKLQSVPFHLLQSGRLLYSRNQEIYMQNKSITVSNFALCNYLHQGVVSILDATISPILPSSSSTNVSKIELQPGQDEESVIIWNKMGEQFEILKKIFFSALSIFSIRCEEPNDVIMRNSILPLVQDASLVQGSKGKKCHLDAMRALFDHREDVKELAKMEDGEERKKVERNGSGKIFNFVEKTKPLLRNFQIAVKLSKADKDGEKREKKEIINLDDKNYDKIIFDGENMTANLSHQILFETLSSDMKKLYYTVDDEFYAEIFDAEELAEFSQFLHQILRVSSSVAHGDNVWSDLCEQCDQYNELLNTEWRQIRKTHSINISTIKTAHKKISRKMNKIARALSLCNQEELAVLLQQSQSFEYFLKNVKWIPQEKRESFLGDSDMSFADEEYQCFFLLSAQECRVYYDQDFDHSFRKIFPSIDSSFWKALVEGEDKKRIVKDTEVIPSEEKKEGASNVVRKFLEGLWSHRMNSVEMVMLMNRITSRFPSLDSAVKRKKWDEGCLIFSHSFDEKTVQTLYSLLIKKENTEMTRHQIFLSLDQFLCVRNVDTRKGESQQDNSLFSLHSYSGVSEEINLVHYANERFLSLGKEQVLVKHDQHMRIRDNIFPVQSLQDSLSEEAFAVVQLLQKDGALCQKKIILDTLTSLTAHYNGRKEREGRDRKSKRDDIEEKEEGKLRRKTEDLLEDTFFTRLTQCELLCVVVDLLMFLFDECKGEEEIFFALLSNHRVLPYWHLSREKEGKISVSLRFCSKEEINFYFDDLKDSDYETNSQLTRLTLALWGEHVDESIVEQIRELYVPSSSHSTAELSPTHLLSVLCEQQQTNNVFILATGVQMNAEKLSESIRGVGKSVQRRMALWCDLVGKLGLNNMTRSFEVSSILAANSADVRGEDYERLKILMGKIFNLTEKYLMHKDNDLYELLMKRDETGVPLIWKRLSQLLVAVTEGPSVNYFMLRSFADEVRGAKRLSLSTCKDFDAMLFKVDMEQKKRQETRAIPVSLLSPLSPLLSFSSDTDLVLSIQYSPKGLQTLSHSTLNELSRLFSPDMSIARELSLLWKNFTLYNHAMSSSAASVDTYLQQILLDGDSSSSLSSSSSTHTWGDIFLSLEEPRVPIQRLIKKRRESFLSSTSLSLPSTSVSPLLYLLLLNNLLVTNTSQHFQNLQKKLNKVFLDHNNALQEISLHHIEPNKSLLKKYEDFLLAPSEKTRLYSSLQQSFLSQGLSMSDASYHAQLKVHSAVSSSPPPPSPPSPPPSSLSPPPPPPPSSPSPPILPIIPSAVSSEDGGSSRKRPRQDFDESPPSTPSEHFANKQYRYDIEELVFDENDKIRIRKLIEHQKLNIENDPVNHNVPPIQVQTKMTGRIGELLAYEALTKESSKYCEVEWVNKDIETGSPYDIRYKVIGEPKGKWHYVEVKATRSHSKTSFELSYKELNAAIKLRGNFHVIRVYGCLNDNFMIHKIDDPATKWETNNVTLLMQL